MSSNARTPEPKAQHTTAPSRPPARTTANLHWLNKTYTRDTLTYQSLGTTSLDGDIVQSETVAWIHSGMEATIDKYQHAEIELTATSEQELLETFGDEDGVYEGVLVEAIDTINHDGNVRYSLLAHTLAVAFRALTDSRGYTPSSEKFTLHDLGEFGFLLENEQENTGVMIAPAVSKA